MKKIFVLTAMIVWWSCCEAQQNAPSARKVLAAAMQEAKVQQKNIFLIFHASWCSWCRKLDSVLESPACKNLMAPHYIITHLSYYETEEKRQLENKGAGKLLAQYGALDAGIPFWVVLDKDGKLLGTSLYKKADGTKAIIGYPGSSGEIKAFTGILKKTSSLQPGELNAIALLFPASH